MEKSNAEELQKLDDRLAEAEKQEGESEISDALRARANYLTRIGDKVRAYPPLYILSRLTLAVGPCCSGAETCFREDAGPGLTDRHCPYSDTHRILLWRSRTHHRAPNESRGVSDTLPGLIYFAQGIVD